MERVGAWRSLVAHLLGVQVVGRSNRLAPTIFAVNKRIIILSIHRAWDRSHLLSLLMNKSMDYALSRRRMVETQLVARGITDEKVIQAFLDVPRHYFVQEALRRKAYADASLPIGEKQTISQPYTVAIMTQLLDVKSHHKVLEIGTGSGYQAAILSRLAKSVYSLERIPILAVKAQSILSKLGIKNVHVKALDGTFGWKGVSPFERIIVTAAAPEIPELLVEQLTDDGRLVIPVGTARMQKLMVLIKQESERTMEEHGTFSFVPLLGRFGWK